MAEIGKLSASKITCYKGCPLAYFLRYVKHVKVPQHVRLAFGKDIHYLLQRFYQVNYKSAESFSKYWKFYWFRSISGDSLKGKAKQELKIAEHPVKKDFILKIGNHVNLGPEPVGVFFGYMKLGEDILKKFYNRHKGKKPPIAVEKSFGVKKDELLDINGHLIRGVFDRIDDVNGKLHLTDYKTDKISPASDTFELHRHPQFTLYSYVFEKIFKMKEEAIWYNHLRSDKFFITHRSEEDYDYLKRVIDDVVKDIEDDKFVPFYGHHCNYCDLKVACEDYSIPYHGGPKIVKNGEIKKGIDQNLWDVEVPDWMEMQEVA